MSDATRIRAMELRFQAERVEKGIASPSTRAENEARLAEERASRERVRAEASAVPLTLGAVLGKLGFSDEYAAHFVQSYCGCYVDDYEGWIYCGHATDLGLG